MPTPRRIVESVVLPARIVIASERLGAYQGLAARLADAGHRVTLLRTGAAVLDELEDASVDLFILCRSLAFSVDDLCRAIRARDRARVVVIALTEGLEGVAAVFPAGADDYLVGLPDPEELRQRLEALVQSADRDQPGGGHRADGGGSLPGPGGLVLDVLAHQVLVGHSVVGLTPKEFAVLRFLLERRGQVVTGDELAEGAWGHPTFGQRNFVEAQISRLRQKLRGAGVEVITTVRGVGYKIA